MVMIQEMEDEPIVVKKEEKKLKEELKAKPETVKMTKRSRKFTLELDNTPPEAEKVKPRTESDKRLAAELDDEEKAKNYPR